jgi:WD40-like Beta Propeller Repeat
VLHCTPHPGLGTVVVRSVAIDLATCRTATAPPIPESLATIRVTKDSQSILFKGKVVLTVHENHKGFPAGSPGPIELEGVSPDRKWILYSIDPQGSASLAADGLTLEAIRTTGGRSYTVSSGLAYGSYRTWCDVTTLVVTAGGDRLAANHKRLIVTGPPAWKPHPLVDEPKRAFGSVVCAPDGNSVVVQEQPQSTNASFFDFTWALWRITLDGKSTQLTHPPAGYIDESPEWAPDQSVLYFVRSKKGYGKLYALRKGKLVGPLLPFGYRLGYYGHQDWPYTVTR